VAWQPYHTVSTLLVFGWIGNYMVRMALSPLLDPVASGSREGSLPHTPQMARG